MQHRPSKPNMQVPVRMTFCVGAGPSREGWIVRLSVAGLEVETSAPPPIGSNVQMAIEFRPRAPIACSGRVQWSNAIGFGAQFTLLGARETHAIVEAMRVSV